MKISKYLISLDIFGTQPVINLNRQPKYRTQFGGILTLLVVAFLILGIILFGKALFTHTNPTIAQSDQAGHLSLTSLQIPPEKFVLGVRSYVNGHFYVNPRIYTIVGKLFTSTFTFTYINFKQCLPQNISSFAGITDQLWCFDIPAGQQINLLYANGIDLLIGACQNSSLNGNSCLDSATIQATLEASTVQVFYTDLSFNYDDYENPVSYYISGGTFDLVFGLTQRINVGFKRVDINTDSGIVTSSFNNVSGVALDFIFSNVNQPVVYGNALVVIDLYNSGRLVTVNRSYKKLQDVVAQVVSVINVFILVFGLLAGKYANLQMYTTVANTILQQNGQYQRKNCIQDQNFKEEDFKNSVKMPEQQRGSVRENLNKENNAEFDPNENDENDIPPEEIAFPDCFENNKKIDQQENQTPDSNNNNVIIGIQKKSTTYKHISAWEMFLSFFCKRRKVVQAEILSGHIEDSLNLTYIISKLNEIERMKEFLLTREQMNIFEDMKREHLEKILSKKTAISNVEHEILPKTRIPTEEK